ncbi:YafY family protein [Polaromonas sp. SM01]|uniref:helix-turn-helix transcriptional regulator n=1 Tax=Polaromonas sp. SM01 TaxID=3085630 RepID=UPI002981E135|nr:YafY family protein [Polaromonas sp. SM01]MDW5441005.1 YafY family protein [Polaromonas sp. SM01]
MRRADRLFQLVQLIRGRRLSTAAYLAGRLTVSARTVYRDIAELQQQGVPLEGEAGVGYRLGAGFALPPLMFTQEEAKALVASVRLAQIGLDAGLSRAADDALGKILSVLPAAARAAAESLAVYAPLIALDVTHQQRLQQLREALQAQHKVRLDYCDPRGKTSQRTIRPLGCFFWGKVWTLAAWCETRCDFRSFRVDRIQSLTVLEAGFQQEAGKTLADFLRQLNAAA